MITPLHTTVIITIQGYIVYNSYDAIVYFVYNFLKNKF